MAALNNNTNVMSSHKTIALKAPKRQVPQLRFKEFDEEWNKYKIGKVFQLKAGGDIDKNHVSDNQSDKFKYPIYANTEKNKGFYGYSDIFKFDSGTITVAGRGVNIGIAHARNHKFYPIVRLLVLKPIKENKLDIYFCEYVINNLNLFIESTGVPQLTAPQLSGYKINLPSLPEQQKIAQFLTAVDSKLLKLTQKKELLEQYKKGVMQQLFSQQLRFKQDDGSDYPDWEEKKLGDVFKAQRGKGISKGEVTEKGISKCILYGELYTKYNEVIYKIESKTNSKNGLYSKIGDLLIPSSTTTTGIDLANVTALNFDNVLLGGDIIVLRAKSKINNVFYAYYLSNHKKNQLASRAQGITIVHLYFSGIKDLYIDFPCYEEQQKIANYLSAIDTKIDTVTQQIEATQQFKKGLLQQMFV